VSKKGIPNCKFLRPKFSPTKAVGIQISHWGLIGILKMGKWITSFGIFGQGKMNPTRKKSKPLFWVGLMGNR